jgi:hypothetical protein
MCAAICGLKVPLFIEPLVLKINLNLLLRGRDDLILGFALEVGEVCHGLPDDIKGLLDLLLCND